MSAETVATGRSKRSTAGNRMRELLEKAHQQDEEDLFKEEEGDEEFTAPVDQRDVFLEDFADTDEEIEMDDEEAEERAIRREERRKAKGKTKGIYNPLGPSGSKPKKVKFPPEPSGASSSRGRGTSTGKRAEDMELLDPNIDPATMAKSTLVLALRKQRREQKRLHRDQNLRSTLRASTLRTEEEILEREKAEKSNPNRKGRLAQHVTGEVRVVRKMTQDELIAAALEEEERNKESLKDWLRKEEERRELRRVGRKRVRGPRWTWVSRTVGKLVEEVEGDPAKDAARISGATPVASTPAPEERPKSPPKTADTGANTAEPDASGKVEERRVHDSSTLPPEADDAGTPEASKPPVSAPQEAPASPTQEVPVPAIQEPPPSSTQEESAPTTQELSASAPVEPSAAPQNPLSSGPQAVSISGPADPSASAPEEPSSAPEQPSSAPEQPCSAPEQPSSAHREPSSSGPTNAPIDGPPAASSTSLQPTPNAAGESSKPAEGPQPDASANEAPSRYTRNYIILSQIPGGLAKELQLVLGDHVEWDQVKYIPHRNRPINRRPVVCPFTGMPAKYRHPQTLIPYANIEGYRQIEALLNHRYLWDADASVWLGGEQDVGAEGVEAVQGWREAMHGGWIGGKDAISLMPEEPAAVADEEVHEEVHVEVPKKGSKRKSQPESDTVQAVSGAKRAKTKRGRGKGRG